jgi:hypothetical protein
MNSQISERHRTIAVDEPDAPSKPDEWTIDAACERLDPLLAKAAALDLDDARGWADLRVTSHATTTLLSAAALLPPHLQVQPDDPPVLVARKIATAWRHVGR